MSVKGNLVGNLAYQAHSKGDIEKARTMYESALRDGLNKANIVEGYGILLLREGNFQEAVDIFSRALTMSPPLTLRYSLRIHRSIAYIKMGNYKSAKVALEDINQKLEDQRVYETLGYFYVLTDDPKAHSYNEKAINLYPDSVTVLDNIAQYYINKKRPEIAREFLEEAYAIDKSKADINYHLALVEETAGNKRKALEYANQIEGSSISPLNDVKKEDVDVLIDKLLK